MQKSNMVFKKIRNKSAEPSDISEISRSTVKDILVILKHGSPILQDMVCNGFGIQPAAKISKMVSKKEQITIIKKDGEEGLRSLLKRDRKDQLPYLNVSQELARTLEQTTADVNEQIRINDEAFKKAFGDGSVCIPGRRVTFKCTRCDITFIMYRDQVNGEKLRCPNCHVGIKKLLVEE